MPDRPNIILILNDDMGFSDLGCYGGEVHTPNLDALASGGLRYTQFYNTARCCPSRASLLTGLYPHQADVGEMTRNDDIDGYRGDLSRSAVTVAEALKPAGYMTYMSGKWHVCNNVEPDGPEHNWPPQRGFDEFQGILIGAASYYRPRTLMNNNRPVEPGSDYFITDAISDQAVRQLREHGQHRSDQPFFQYVAYTAPHWPLHAHEQDIAKYHGRFDAGWDQLRKQRLQRMIDMGLIEDHWQLTERDADVGPWEDQPYKGWETRRMEVYAAQIDRMDQGIGRIVDQLKADGQFDNTLILFLADNGGCAEGIGDWVTNSIKNHAHIGHMETHDGRPVRFGNSPDIMPGSEDTYCSYGKAWANLSNTPFREYKCWVHEGGIATPLIAHWPAGIAARNELRHQPGQLPDIMATLLDVAGADYPTTHNGQDIKPLEGFTMTPTFTDGDTSRDALYFEHMGNRAVRRGKWKLVAKQNEPWELFDMQVDRSETHDLASDHPQLVAELTQMYQAWARRCNVMEYDDLRELRQPKFRARRQAERQRAAQAKADIKSKADP